MTIPLLENLSDKQFQAQIKFLAPPLIPHFPDLHTSILTARSLVSSDIKKKSLQWGERLKKT